MPPHLCHVRTSLSLLSCMDNNKPIILVTTADSAAHSQRKCNHSFSFWIGSHNVRKETISNTIGKCKNIGCILPTTCSQFGISNFCSNRRMKSRKKNAPIKMLSQIFLTTCIMFLEALLSQIILYFLVNHQFKYSPST